MNNISTQSDIFDEKQALQTIKKVIGTSRKKLMEDGILLICWGMAFSLGFAWNYYNSVKLVASRIQDIMLILKPATAVVLILFTIYYIFFRNKRATSHSAISTRFVWLGIIIAHNLNVIISNTIIGTVSFELLHPLQMTLIGFALFVTGGIYRVYYLSLSGVVMWIAAAVAAGYDLNAQFLVRAIADFICFVVPGTLMFTEVKKGRHV